MSAIKTTITILAFCSFISSTWAEIKPNALFSDNAVLQQNVSIPVWGTAKEGEKVAVTFDGETGTAVAKDGKWMVRLKPHKAGGPYTMTIAGENTITANNILVGEVWICSGQSNMAFKFPGSTTATTEAPAANYPKLRMFNVDHKLAINPQADESGKWIECSPSTVKDFSAVGYFFGRDIHKATGVPVGMIHTSVGGTGAQLWTSLTGLQKEPSLRGYVEDVSSAKAKCDPAAEAKYTQDVADYERKLKAWDETTGKEFGQAIVAWNAECAKNKTAGTQPPPRPEPALPKPRPPVDPVGKTATALFNGMVAPLIPYAIKGVIWYQGESNNGKPFEYRTLFPRLIADWREKWGEGDFPFLFVQIAPYKDDVPEVREAQFLTWKKTPNTAMAVTVDVGDANNIHPKQKEPVGQRLAIAARALVYGEKIEYSGPEYDSMKVDKNRAILNFNHIGSGLVAKDGPLKGFTIAGADKHFVEAKAEIRGDTVVVTSEQISSPAAVRYGFTNIPDGNLWNKEGLPASTFRTDPESMTKDTPPIKKPVPTTDKPET
ncbi:MAG: sialate O-acetylesterase [Verrucomicrobiota bacterium]